MIRSQRITQQVDLDGLKYRFSEEMSYTLSLQMTSASSFGIDVGDVASDGQSIRHDLSFQSKGDGANPPFTSNVTIVTHVEALPSCSRSSGKLARPTGAIGAALASVSPLNPQLRVEVELLDVDGLPIRTSLPRAVIKWEDGSKESYFALVRTMKGSQVFIGDVPASSRSSPGLYQLSVLLLEAWNEADDNECACTILTLPVVVNASIQDFRCPAGSFRPGTGADCQLCRAGFYQPEAGDDAKCLSCSVFQDGDSYQNESGATMCKQCPEGTRRRASSINWEQPEDCV